MSSSINQNDDEAELAAIARQLGNAIYTAIPDWVIGCIESRYLAWSKQDVLPAELAQAARAAATKAQEQAGNQVKAVLALDIDQQQVPPLSLLRSAVKYPTAILSQAGVPPVMRDEFAERNFPEDLYDLNPAAFGDVSPDLHELGMAWGAAKAFVHLKRRRS